MLLPASVLALSAGMVMYGCEDPAEVSEEELMVETIDELEGADGPEPAQGDERHRLVETIDADELVRRTASKLRGDRRRFGRLYLGVYLVLAVGFIVLVCNFEPTPT